MTHLKLPSGRDLSRPFLLAFLLSLLPLFVHADGGGLPTDVDPVNASVPGDEVTSLPIVADPTGLTLVGHARELRALVRAVEGRGVAVVRRLNGGRLAVTWMGDYRLVFDRAELARGRVRFYFLGGRLLGDAIAIVSVAGSDPMRLPAARIEIPVARLAGSGLLGVGLELLARDDPHGVRVSGTFGEARVVWTQILR